MTRNRNIVVLVTGTGGGVGQSILKSLSSNSWKVITADADPLAAGLYAGDRGYLVPYAVDRRYIPRLCEIIRREKVKYVFPGLDAELPILARAANTLKDAGAVVVVSSPRVVRICDDKLATAEFLKSHGFPYPKTWPGKRANEWRGPYPIILKPKTGGHRSIGVHRARNRKEMLRLLKSLNPERYVIQEEIEGEEYTCGSVTFDGRCLGVIAMRRILRFGDTYKAWVVCEPVVEEVVRCAAEKLNPFGPCNFQLRLRDGIPYIFEINARCSGTTYARALAGFNEPELVVKYLEGMAVKRPIRIRRIAILRYWNELVVDESRLASLRRTGHVKGDKRSWLRPGRR